MLHKCFVILKLAQFYTHYVSASYIFFFHLQFAKIEAAAHSCPRERKHAGAQFLNKVSAVSKKKNAPLTCDCGGVGGLQCQFEICRQTEGPL